VGQKQSAQDKELRKIIKQQDQLEKNLQSLITLFSNKAVTIEQFTAQNQRIQTEQQTLVIRKIELESILETQKDTEQLFRAFQKQITLFAQLDIDDEQVLKQLLHQVIHKIEIHQDGSIKIDYNLAQPQVMGNLLQGA
jgi:site-specific DNA recombinase